MRPLIYLLPFLLLACNTEPTSNNTENTQEESPEQFKMDIGNLKANVPILEDEDPNANSLRVQDNIFRFNPIRNDKHALGKHFPDSLSTLFLSGKISCIDQMNLSECTAHYDRTFRLNGEERLKCRLMKWKEKGDFFLNQLFSTMYKKALDGVIAFQEIKMDDVERGFYFVRKNKAGLYEYESIVIVENQYCLVTDCIKVQNKFVREIEFSSAFPYKGITQD